MNHTNIELRLRFMSKVLRSRHAREILDYVSLRDLVPPRTTQVMKELRMDKPIFYRELRSLVNIGAINKNKYEGRSYLSLSGNWLVLCQHIENLNGVHSVG